MVDLTNMTDEQKHILPLKPDGSSYQFMIVDDSAFMINNLTRVISGFQGKVLCSAVDGVDAVQTYEQLPVKPDLITMDITMPNMDGLTCLKKILGMQTTQKVVMVSALGQKEAVRAAIVLGAKHFIVKPFQRENVYKVFRSVMGI